MAPKGLFTNLDTHIYLLLPASLWTKKLIYLAITTNFLFLCKVRYLLFDDGKVRGVELFSGLNVFDGDKRHESKESLVGALVVNIRQKDSQIWVECLQIEVDLVVAHIGGLLGGRVVDDLADGERVDGPGPAGGDPAHVAHGSGAVGEAVSAVDGVVHEPGDAVLVAVHAHAVPASQDVLVAYGL